MTGKGLKPPIRRTDTNQAQIVRELREAGYAVRDTHALGSGFPDIIVARDGIHGVQVLVEIKTSWAEHLTDDEREFFQVWPGAKIVATCAKDVIDWFSERPKNGT